MLRRRRQLAAGAIGAAALAVAPAAHANSFTVTSNADTGAGSLRQAVSDANASAGADTITFDSALVGPTITLTSGELPITANEDLTITGPGHTALSVSGNDASRIFDITANSSSHIAISGLTLTHGLSPSSSNGGALFNGSGAALTLNDVAITDSHATNNGGGLSTDGNLELSASTISGNTATNTGGGVYLSSFGKYSQSSLVSIDSTTISGNQASGGNGGGVFVQGATVTLSHSTLSGNGSSAYGGGLAGFPKYGITVQSSTVSGNTAAQGGGGLSLDSSTNTYAPITVTQSTISGNQSVHGAGVAVSYIDAGNPFTISQSTISGNHGAANSFGGGIDFQHGIAGSATLVDSTISGNSATNGGGVSLGDDSNAPLLGKSGGKTTGSIDLANSTIAGNAAAANGGGIYLSQYDAGSPSTKQSATADLTSTVVAGNTAAGAASDLDRADTSTTGGFDSAFSLVQAPGDAPFTKQQATIVGKDAQLGALGDNGGPTATMRPAGTSPVIDQGKSHARLDTDQRGAPRLVDSGLPNAPDGDGTDIGAVELSADQVVLPPPPPSATFDVTVRGTSVSPGTPLLPASTTPLVCSVTVVSMSSCDIELRLVKSAKLSKKTTLPKGTLLAEGTVPSSAGASTLSVKVKLTRDGKAVLKALPVGVDTVVQGTAATGTTSALTKKGVVHLLAGQSVTLGVGKRKAKLPSTANKRLDELAKLIPNARTVKCTAYSDKGKGDLALTKTWAKEACTRLVKKGVRAKVSTSGKGHAKPIASNRTKKGRALNRRIVITFTL